MACRSGLYPEAAGSLRLVTSGPITTPSYLYDIRPTLSDAYRFAWSLYHKGIPVQGSRITVTVDRATLDITGFSAWLETNAAFPDAGVTISKGEATEQFRKRVKPYLFYQSSIYDDLWEDGVTAQLLYDFHGLWDSLNAITGKWESDEYASKPTGQPLPVLTGETVTAAQLPLTEETGRTLAATILGEPPENLSLEIAPEEVPERLLPYTTKEGSIVVLNEATGAILFASRPDPSMADLEGSLSPDMKPAPERNEASRQLALQLVHKYFSPYESQLQLEDQTEKDPWMYPFQSFRFQRVKDGIPVEPDHVEITLSPDGATWATMFAIWTPDSALPSPSGAMKPDKALDLVLGQHELMLQYRPVRPAYADEPDPVPTRRAPVEMELVYKLTAKVPDPTIDALTGKFLVEPWAPKPPQPAEELPLEGHWAEGQLRYMVRNGALPAKQLSADGPLSREQAASMLALASILTEEPFSDLSGVHPGAPVTRAQVAVWAARALGLGDLARSELTSRAGFTDLGHLSAEEQNAAAFLQALGLLSPGTSFRGNEVMTQAEGATLAARLYNYLLER